jgi:hypothetical protein
MPLFYRYIIILLNPALDCNMASGSSAYTMGEDQDDDSIDQQNRFMAEKLSGKVSRLKSVHSFNPLFKIDYNLS